MKKVKLFLFRLINRKKHLLSNLIILLEIYKEAYFNYGDSFKTDTNHIKRYDTDMNRGMCYVCECIFTSKENIQVIEYLTKQYEKSDIIPWKYNENFWFTPGDLKSRVEFLKKIIKNF